MAMEFIYTMLGPWSRTLIPWVVEHPAALAAVYIVWMILLWTGKFQQRRVENYLIQWVVELNQVLKSQNKKSDSKTLYEHVRQELRQSILRLAWFIPHKTEAFPIPAFPKLVEQKLKLSPDWVTQVLKENKKKQKGQE